MHAINKQKETTALDTRGRILTHTFLTTHTEKIVKQYPFTVSLQTYKPFSLYAGAVSYTHLTLPTRRTV